jgi:hypothetical protein
MIVAGFFIRTFMGVSSSHRAAVAGHLYDSCRGRDVTVDDQEWLAKRFEEELREPSSWKTGGQPP